MTLQNLRYVIEVANSRSFSKAAQVLFMSQSALSTAVREVEDELGTRIFLRTNRGVTLTTDGEDCLKYCREIIERSDYLLSRYHSRNDSRANFSVSSQHLPFAMRAYQELLNTHMPEEYNAAIRENNTSAVLHDVSSERSELGIAVFQEEQLELMRRSLYVHDLQFTELERINTFVFVRKLHPLAGHESLSLRDLQEYPFVTYDQDETPNYYSEEFCPYSSFGKHIHVCDRATKMYVIRSSDAFSIGVDLPNFNLDIYFQKQVTGVGAALLAAIPFADQVQPVKVGYLSKNGHALSPLAELYIRLLVEQIRKLTLPGAMPVHMG